MRACVCVCVCVLLCVSLSTIVLEYGVLNGHFAPTNPHNSHPLPTYYLPTHPTTTKSQLVLDCADLKDFSGITGNPAKFGLGFVSIIFDLVFFVQHYCLYNSSSDSTNDDDDNDNGWTISSTGVFPATLQSEQQEPLLPPQYHRTHASTNGSTCIADEDESADRTASAPEIISV